MDVEAKQRLEVAASYLRKRATYRVPHLCIQRPHRQGRKEHAEPRIIRKVGAEGSGGV